MSAHDNLSPAQFNNVLGRDTRPPLQMTEPDLVPYPKQLGFAGRMRLGYAHLRTKGMSEDHAYNWGKAHGYDAGRLAYGDSGWIRSPYGGHSGIDRENLPKKTRNGW